MSSYSNFSQNGPFRLCLYLRPFLANFPALANYLQRIDIDNTILNSPLSQPGVEGVFQESFVVSADVDLDGQRHIGLDSRAGRVQRQFPDRNAHPLTPQVPKAQNALAIRHHNSLRILELGIIEPRVFITLVTIHILVETHMYTGFTYTNYKCIQVAIKQC